MTIRIAVRRFRCANRYCARQTFAETLTEVAGRFGRKTGCVGMEGGQVRHGRTSLGDAPRALLYDRMKIAVIRDGEHDGTR